ncbi:hypothetical protein TRFO_37865 [Tritrichomonas foetus]|uniref:Uncharacterized protein n=1 Tax=Tritrichomonas foetus TaxID=1144522 RepID=A0A1J4JE82_9EUKA|nr:hypothetical protein TRFO_37865 [Tritrichomonas foetus]|eukprot:OHS95971.1 hypothetical protein TRFO_37865 [Tritrichomonas foetus]
MEGIFFADRARGIYGLNDGSFFLTYPNTFTPICSPFYIPPPYRIYTSSEIDPYIACFSNNGVIFIFNAEKYQCVITATLPPIKSIITKVKILSGGKRIELITEGEKLLYDGYWRLIEEDPDKLVIKSDQKIVSQCSVLEDEVCNACREGDIDAFKKSVERYCIYLAEYTPVDKFLDSWFELVNRTSKMGPKALQILSDVIDILGSFELVQPHIDELRMAISTV